MRFTRFIMRSPPTANLSVAMHLVCKHGARAILLSLFACVIFIGLNNGMLKDACAHQTLHQSSLETTRIALLIFGDEQTAGATDGRLRKQFSRSNFAQVLDPDLALAAARGAGYAGSLNLSVEEAHDLGAAIGCDYLLLADAQTIRRSSSDKPVYYEAYASLFLVEARTGKLLAWNRPRQESLQEREATDGLMANITTEAAWFIEQIKEHRARFPVERTNASDDANSFASSIQSAESEDYREPQPYRRISPAYTDAAYKAEVEATVDAQVDINETGEVVRVEIVRWAGFDLDESVARAIKAMHFRPAQLSGKAKRARVLLRYNFRRPPKRSEEAETNLFSAPL